MDEQAFHASRQSTNPAPCVFEKAILAGCAQCSVSNKRSLAEREVVACTVAVARINCGTLASLFRERATFALRLPPPSQPIPHAKAMQLQCGGLRGLQSALGDEGAAMDIHALVQQGHANASSLLDLPWEDVVKSITAWQGRRRTPTAP